MYQFRDQQLNRNGCNDHDYYLCNTSDTCILTHLVNDLIPDCSPPEDEPILSRELETLIHVPDHSCITQGTLPCRPGHPRCFPLHALCVYDIDEYGHQRYCRNGAHLHNCESIGCPTKYKCPGSYCIPVKRVCDGVGDCPGLEDEVNCYNTSLLCPGFFRCRSGSCLDQSEVCDGHQDCDSGEDETDYHIASCPSRCECQSIAMVCENITIGQMPLNINISGYKTATFGSKLPSVPRLLNGLNLHILFLSNVGLESVNTHAFTHLSALTSLDLSLNNLTTIKQLVFSGLSNLRRLDLSSNPTLLAIHHLALKGLLNLKVLDLSNTGLIKLPPALFQGTISLKRVDINAAQLKELDLHIFKKLHRSLVFNMTRNKHLSKFYNLIEFANSSLSEKIHITTDIAMVCCMLGNTDNCLLHAHKDKKNWCGQSFSIFPYSFWNTIPFNLMAVLSVIAMVSLYIRRHINPVRFALTISLHVTDLLLAAHLASIWMKDYMFDYSVIHHRSGGKYIFCNVAASLQLAGLLGQSFLVMLNGLLLKDSLQILSKLEPKTILLGLFAAKFTIFSLSVLTVFFGLMFFTLNDVCSFAVAVGSGAGFPITLLIPATLAGVMILSITTTLYLYWRSRRILKISIKAVTAGGGIRTGNSYHASVVIKLFVHNALLPILLQLVIIVYSSIVLFGGHLEPIVQFVVVVHVIPGVTLISTCFYLLRYAKARFSQ